MEGYKMFLVDTQNKKAVSLEKKTFSELMLSERYDLQEWIASNPNILGENLLIIQKEFDGFPDTNERLDLLALDESGKLVIIEKTTGLRVGAVTVELYLIQLSTRIVRELSCILIRAIGIKIRAYSVN